MIQLIVSDIDGTLLPYGTKQLDPSVFSLIHRLSQRGIRFCPASGRQFHSLRRLFGPVQDELCYVCENGAILYGSGTEESAPVLGKTVMERTSAMGLIRDIIALDGSEVLISGANCSYLCQCDNSFVTRMRDGTGNHVQVVRAPEEIEEDIIKISACCRAGAAVPEKALGEKWSGVFNMAVAGAEWLDFTLADKGIGLRQLCSALNIPLENVMAFGDNWNDLPMLEAAGHPYLMASADPRLAEKLPRQCTSVPQVLEQLLTTGCLPNE